jgi:iron-sulfur cluster repair protein YtfE (RIC family)
VAGDLVAHLAVEEHLLYPAISRVLNDESWIRRARRLRAQTRQSLDRMLDTPLDGERFADAVGELREHLEEHAREEERIVFPLLERVVDADAMRALATAMLRFYDASVEAGYARDSVPLVAPAPLEVPHRGVSMQ